MGLVVCGTDMLSCFIHVIPILILGLVHLEAFVGLTSFSLPASFLFKVYSVQILQKAKSSQIKMPIFH